MSNKTIPSSMPRSLVIKTGLVGLMCFLCVSVAKANGFFSFVDDDATGIGAISKMETVARSRGIKICFGVVASRVANDPRLQEKLLEYQSWGHQICNHSLTHGKNVWTECDTENLEMEIECSRNMLEKLGFRDVDYFIYPYGKFSREQFTRVQPIVSRNNKLAFNSRGRFNLPGSNAYYLDRFALRKFNDLSMVKRVVDAAQKNDGWIVFMTHSASSRDFDADYVAQVMDYCLSLGLTNCTLEEYRSLHGNIFETNGDIHEYTIFDEVLDIVYLNLFKISILLPLLVLVVFACILRKKRSLSAKKRSRKI